jgi:hypothetical protein
MELSNLISGLLRDGRVTVGGVTESFIEEDIELTGVILRDFYKEDSLEMPYIVPSYSEEAAMWAARYIFHAIQLTVARDAGEEVVLKLLEEYDGEMSIESIYSADLVLRHLPSLFILAKGLAPADILVSKLTRVAKNWPFSSVGIELDEINNEEKILQHPSLKQEYIDRIIKRKDLGRIRDLKIEQYLFETTGSHLNELWPGYAKEFKLPVNNADIG